MDKSKRSAVIAGNWKMNKTPNEAKALLNELAPMVKDADCEVIKILSGIRESFCDSSL